jgi:hypothetical protein
MTTVSAERSSEWRRETISPTPDLRRTLIRKEREMKMLLMMVAASLISAALLVPTVAQAGMTIAIA